MPARTRNPAQPGSASGVPATAVNVSDRPVRRRPAPGNVLGCLPDGRVGFVDFGFVYRLDSGGAVSLEREVITALLNGDRRAAYDAAVRTALPSTRIGWRPKASSTTSAMSSAGHVIEGRQLKMPRASPPGRRRRHHAYQAAMASGHLRQVLVEAHAFGRRRTSRRARRSVALRHRGRWSDILAELLSLRAVRRRHWAPNMRNGRRGNASAQRIGRRTDFPLAIMGLVSVLFWSRLDQKGNRWRIAAASATPGHPRCHHRRRTGGICASILLQDQGNRGTVILDQAADPGQLARTTATQVWRVTSWDPLYQYTLRPTRSGSGCLDGSAGLGVPPHRRAPARALRARALGHPGGQGGMG